VIIDHIMFRFPLFFPPPSLDWIIYRRAPFFLRFGREDTVLRPVSSPLKGEGDESPSILEVLFSYASSVFIGKASFFLECVSNHCGEETYAVFSERNAHGEDLQR